jgi:DNA-binding transcriptional regulator GbsR (MarR family)
MSDLILTPGAIAIIDWLGELGPRWGLPGEACRVHGLLFLTARSLSAGEIAGALRMSEPVVEDAIAWLSENRLIAQDATGWSTPADPWMLVTQALEARRAAEMGTARAVREAWEGDRQGEDPVVTRQARRLFDLVEDVASIDASARRLSPEAMRALIGFGGRAARFADRAFGSRRRGA